MAQSDWASQIDWDRVAVNVAEDSKGDWYRDPWGWPEYKFALQGDRKMLLERVRGSDAKRVARIDVPKGNFATRPAVVLDPIDRLILQGTADFNGPKLIGDLPRWVYGWRLSRQSPDRYAYRDNTDEWDGYRAHLQRLVSTCPIGLRSDIVSCFASIPVERACEDVYKLAGENAITGRLVGMLELYDQVPDRRGVPQRSFASCVLANMYLRRLDEVLGDYSAKQTHIWARMAGGDFATRWMDDLWIFGWDEASLRSLQYDLQNVAREAGLELNSSKTDVFEGDELASEALQVEHSAVDGALAEDKPDVVPLEELIDSLLLRPAHADRTSIRFAMTRMRRNKVKSRLSELLGEAQRMPQGADHLARAFRDFKLWKDLQDWFLDFEQSDWARIRWAVAQFGTMFPTKGPVESSLADRFLEILEADPELPMFALATQRLASWRSDDAKDLFRDLASRSEHPLKRRLLGFALVAVKEDRPRIRRLLNEYEENRITLGVIEQNDFRPFSPVSDFAADA